MLSKQLVAVLHALDKQFFIHTLKYSYFTTVVDFLDTLPALSFTTKVNFVSFDCLPIDTLKIPFEDALTDLNFFPLR